jgi:SAM-dependent methyltransferase
MNKNSLQMMKDFKEKYVTGTNLKVLDIGSRVAKRQSWLGTYRKFFLEHEYLGVDMEEGENVDLVVNEAYVLPFEDDHFDVVISGQTMEHMEQPWTWIKEVARVLKPGGLACIIAPALVHLHRYPIDCYRYYPDGMRGLAKWAGLEVLETESRETHEWNQVEIDTFLIVRK